MRKLLLAGASEIFSESIYALLQNKYKFYTCGNCTELADRIDSLKPDALILDLMLPGGNALESLHDAHCKPSKIVALTSFISGQVLAEAKSAGIDHVLLIPCTANAVAKYL